MRMWLVWWKMQNSAAFRREHWVFPHWFISSLFPNIKQLRWQNNADSVFCLYFQIVLKIRDNFTIIFFLQLGFWESLSRKWRGRRQLSLSERQPSFAPSSKGIFSTSTLVTFHFAQYYVTYCCETVLQFKFLYPKQKGTRSLTATEIVHW